MEGLVKVGLPMGPGQFEWVWAKPTGRSSATIANIPFFTRAKVTLEDEIYFRTERGMRVYTRAKLRSGNDTALVAFKDGIERGRYMDLRKQIHALGLETESALVGVLAVLIRKTGDWETLEGFLEGVKPEVKAWGRR